MIVSDVIKIAKEIEVKLKLICPSVDKVEVDWDNKKVSIITKKGLALNLLLTEEIYG